MAGKQIFSGARLNAVDEPERARTREPHASKPNRGPPENSAPKAAPPAERLRNYPPWAIIARDPFRAAGSAASSLSSSCFPTGRVQGKQRKRREDEVNSGQDESHWQKPQRMNSFIRR